MSFLKTIFLRLRVNSRDTSTSSREDEKFHSYASDYEIYYWTPTTGGWYHW
ncbi:MAG TPA: hypothetical protein VL202_04915 [Pararhizobium sp.]|uniref:hypothetical protein n=1 Tax=Pararhizobium sp. TaxID=1977563 RepID=UPI002B555917|nr:hypothetical protein [Pararhizobium sp.]HTO30506.1 hypothetical protein [Pararhizobium sp.]